jgi:hypothetical protein
LQCPVSMKRVLVTLRILRAAWIAAVALLAGQVVVDACAGARELWHAREARARAIFLSTRGYLMWADDGLGRRCPPDAAALARAAGHDARPDPWGTPYQLRCVDGEWPRVFSAGPDRIPGTGDDVHPR